VDADARGGVPSVFPRLSVRCHESSRPSLANLAVHAGARVNVTCVTPLGEETASTA
jgi:hypothetical protein